MQVHINHRIRRAVRTAAIVAALGLAIETGCYPAPERVAAPPQSGITMQHRDPIKPMPDPTDTAANIQPGFDDVPLVNQRPPEEPRYVQAYAAVGRPRVMIFVNRTLSGDLMPVNPNGPIVSVENTQQSNGSVKVGQNNNTYNNSPYNSYSQNYNRSFESSGPAKYQDRTDVYLQPGQYDEAAAKSIDYEMIENILTDWLSGSGQVTIISPIAARGRLTDQEVQELQSGRPQMLSEIAQKLQTDVLVQITAHPSQQTSTGLGIRLIAQALNTKGGQAIAQASVDVPPPMEKTVLNRYTRFVARKLMDEMTNSWNVMASQPAPPTTLAPPMPPAAASSNPMVAPPAQPPVATPPTLPNPPAVAPTIPPGPSGAATSPPQPIMPPVEQPPAPNTQPAPQ